MEPLIPPGLEAEPRIGQEGPNRTVPSGGLPWADPGFTSTRGMA